MSNSERTGYRPDIDGLRAVAILSVVIFHYSATLFPGGYLGVDTFFVISGFLITSHIFRDLSRGRFSFTGFYARRFRRIMPALIAVIAATTVIAVFLLSPLELIRYAISAAASLLGASNIDFFRSLNYFAPSAERQLLLMTWSLGVEEQFYLVLPVCLGLIYRFRPKLVFPGIALLTLISLLLYAWGQAHIPTAAFFLLPFRAWELGFGALLALATTGGTPKALQPAIRQNILSAAGLFLLISGFVVGGSDQESLRILATLAVALGTTALIAAPKARINQYLLSLPPLVALGLISYSLYLWHWPLLTALRLVAPDGLGLLQTLVLAVVTVGLAVLSWAYIERPFRRPLEASDRKTVLRYAGAVGITLVPLALIFVMRGLERFAAPPLVRAERYITMATHDPCLASYGISTPIETPACRGNSTGPAIALLGDSHASALALALKELATAKGLRFVQYTKASCAPLSGYTRFMPAHKGHDVQCAAFMNKAFELVQADPDIRSVVLAGYWAAPLEEAAEGARFIAAGDKGESVSADQSRENLRAGLIRAASQLKSSGRTVILVQDVPHFAFDPMDSLKGRTIPLRGWLGQILAGQSSDAHTGLSSAALGDAARPIVARAANEATITLVDPWQNLCGTDTCLYGVQDDTYYVDKQHLSLPGARQAITGVRLN